MEYCVNGELFDYIVQHQRLHEKAAIRIYQQLICGIEYIHKSGVCHRDLKPENLLLDFDKTLKIVDFGLSNRRWLNSFNLGKSYKARYNQMGRPKTAGTTLSPPSHPIGP